MKKIYTEFGDYAERNGSQTDYLSLIAMFAGVAGLITFLVYLGVIVDTIISLVEMA